MPNWLKLTLLGFTLILAVFAVLFFPKAPEGFSLGEDSQLPSSGGEARSVIRIATVDAFPHREQTRIRPMIDMLNELLGPEGIRVEARTVGNRERLLQLIEMGTIQGYYDSPGAVSLVTTKTDFTPVLVREADEVSKYGGVIFVSSESFLRKLEDLKGHRLGVESRFSTSTFFLPLELIAAETDLPVVLLTSLESTPAPEAINLVFTEQESVSLVWVLDGRIEAGVMKDIAFDQLDEEMRSRVRELARTPLICREILSLSEGMETNLREILVKTLTSLHETPEGETALAKFSSTRRFSTIDDAAALQARLQTLSEVSTPPLRP